MPKKILAVQRISKLGWKRDLPDPRDHKLNITKQAVLPSSVDLRPSMPAVYDQSDLGSCTSNAVAGLAQFLMKKWWKTPTANFIPSRLFLYYNQRVIEGTVGVDAGSSLRTAMKVVQSVGCPHESFWGYDTSKFTTKPPGSVYFDAKSHKLKSYQSINQDHDSICSMLASGYPIVFGFAAFEELETSQVAQSGVIPMPGSSSESIGGHAIALAGYDEPSKLFLIRNSWGAGWGKSGYATMPYDYVLSGDLAADFWTAHTIF